MAPRLFILAALTAQSSASDGYATCNPPDASEEATLLQGGLRQRQSIKDHAHTISALDIGSSRGCEGQYEAEDASISGAVEYPHVNSAHHQGFTGRSFVNYLNNNDDYVEWTLEDCWGGPATAKFRYALRNGNRPLELIVNGNTVEARLAFPGCGANNWRTYCDVTTEVELVPGTNTIKLLAAGSSGANMDHLEIQHTGPPPPEDQCNGRYEAEEAVTHGAVFDSGNENHEGFTGSGFIDYLNPTGDYIEWSLPSCSGGEATLHFRYALFNYAVADPDRPLQVLLNGVEVAASLSFPPTGSFARYTRTALTVTLIPGVNTVRLVATGASGANIDSLLVLSGTPSYYIATYGDAACPSGKDVMSYAECETAHNQLELEIDPVWTGDHSGIPSMCSTREHNWGGQHHFHWDTSGVGTGVSRADLAPVCHV